MLIQARHALNVDNEGTDTGAIEHLSDDELHKMAAAIVGKLDIDGNGALLSHS